MHGEPQDRRAARPPWPSELPGRQPVAWDAPAPPLPAVPPPPGVPASPTGRVPQWVLDEMTGRAADPVPWRSWDPSPAPRRRSSAARSLLVVALVVALGVGAASLAGRLPWSTTPEFSAGGGLTGPAGDRPTPGYEAASAPLGRPAPAPDAASHAFLLEQDDSPEPVAYDPCRPVHYVIASHGAPWDAEHLVADALEPIAAATGLRFVHDGTTDETWSDRRLPYQPDRYGDRWAPVLVSWATPEEVPALADSVAGIGGSHVASAGGPEVYVTGEVTIDAGWTAAALRSRDGRDAVRAVLMHEFGHVLGLDHVEDASELMAPTNEGQLEFGPGDLAGLAQLGRGACEPGL